MLRKVTAAGILGSYLCCLAIGVYIGVRWEYSKGYARGKKDGYLVGFKAAGGYNYLSAGDIYLGYENTEKEKAKEAAELASKIKSWKEKPTLAPPNDPPPSRILVGDLVYQVRYTSREALHMQDALSCTDIEKRVIWLDPGRISDLRGDLLHELMHASGAFWNHNVWDKDSYWGKGEETAIEKISPTLLIVLRDNPTLVEWLRGPKI